MFEELASSLVEGDYEIAHFQYFVDRAEDLIYQFALRQERPSYQPPPKQRDFDYFSKKLYFWDLFMGGETSDVKRALEGAEIDGLKLKKIGAGSSRMAYRVGDTDYVLKWGHQPTNRQEMRVWRNAKPQLRKYLAEPVAISKYGSCLLCKHVPLPGGSRKIKHRLPPRFRWDVRPDNVRRTKKGSPKLIDFELEN